MNKAWPDSDAPAVMFQNVTNASVIRATAPDGTRIFLKVGSGSRGIRVQENDFRKASVPWQIDPGVPADTFTARENMLPK